MRTALREIFVRELGIKPDDFFDDLAYNSIPEWDSASHMALVLAIEEKYGVALESEDIVSMTSVHKILAILQGKGIAP